ncbi:MAG: tryptophan 7-halogenase [Myxococcales bacterium]|nr:tryptophan 7-halogenase [Myxococcales bacterium]MCB9732443.1 tryptophan 7-halogenase [Deltaproteobacteria bacterium]
MSGGARLSDNEGQFWDVVICGGGLAGLLLAMQLRQEAPELTVAVLERTERPLPDAAHKVGESSVELGSQYLERLGLEPYLLERHLIKFALRFFPGGGDRPLAERTEIGPNGEPVVRSYQLDRGRFEEDVRGMIVDRGASLFEGVQVKDIALAPGEEPHTVTAVQAGETHTLRCRWAVDATGRTGLIRRDLKLKRGSPQVANASWFRVKGKLDINSLVPAEETTWHARPYASERWRSTNHLMGAGYWTWIIPLGTGNTSIGVVVHDALHGFDEIRTLERTQAWLAEHEPVLHEALKSYEIMDFMCLKGYSHQVARAWSEDRWALVGEAGAFIDPFYSPGTDFIAIANAYTAELIKMDRRGEALADKVRSFNLTYRSLVSGAIDVYRQAAHVYGHGRALSAKIYWDNFSYWSFPCQYWQQRLYELPVAEHDQFAMAGARFVQLSNYVQGLLAAWAELVPVAAPEAQFVAMPSFPSLLVDAHLALQNKMTTAETKAYVERRAREGAEVVREIVLRVVQEVGPEIGAEVLRRAGYWDWDLAVDPERLPLEELRGMSRRHGLSAIARDVERTLGPPVRHDDAAAARALLLRKSAAA